MQSRQFATLTFTSINCYAYVYNHVQKYWDTVRTNIVTLAPLPFQSYDFVPIFCVQIATYSRHCEIKQHCWRGSGEGRIPTALSSLESQKPCSPKPFSPGL